MLKFIQGAGRIRPDKIGVAELHLRVIENIFLCYHPGKIFEALVGFARLRRVADLRFRSIENTALIILCRSCPNILYLYRS